MRNKFDQQLNLLNEQLTKMGSLIESAISNATKALSEEDETFAKNAIEYEHDIDGLEKDIENLCLTLLLQQQPVAHDLRLISSALKMITDMERIGDQASDISEITKHLKKGKNIKHLEHIPLMAQETIDMVTKSVDAFVKKDIALATSVVKADDKVDKYFELIRNDLISLIHDDVKNGEGAIDLIMIAKYFERIGDHATNIAEWVIFSITGTHNISFDD